MADRGYLSIGEVLSLLKPEFPDLTISKIRFLESQGLLDPERTPSGYRKFYDPDIERLRWILQQQHEKFLPLKVIRGRLGDEANGAGPLPGAFAAGALAASPADAPADEAGGSVDAGGAPIRRGRERATPVLAPSPPPTPPGEAVSLTVEDLAATTGLTAREIGELERYGLLASRAIGGARYYEADALEIAKLAAAFAAFGVEARHLRMYRTSVEREASFFGQVVMPMIKQRNPVARRQAAETLAELSRLGQGLREALLRQALRGHVPL